MHFNADDSSVLMMMDLISSANDFCIVVGICDYLGKINEIDLRLFLLQESHLFARGSLLENNGHAQSEVSTAEGNLLLSPNQQTRETFVERANEKTDEELYRPCEKSD